jgi:hypothetical protein
MRAERSWLSFFTWTLLGILATASIHTRSLPENIGSDFNSVEWMLADLVAKMIDGITTARFDLDIINMRHQNMQRGMFSEPLPVPFQSLLGWLILLTYWKSDV